MHSMKAVNRKTLAAILLVAVVAFSRNIDARVDVQVMNQLENGRHLIVHCRSRDDDLRYQMLEEGEAMEWGFEVNLWRTTLFYCDVQWENSSWFHFDAYDADRDYRRCRSLCRWMIDREGLLYGYDQDLGFWRRFPLIPTRGERVL